jgi:HEAT repeat protein
MSSGAMAMRGFPAKFVVGTSAVRHIVIHESLIPKTVEHSAMRYLLLPLLFVVAFAACGVAEGSATPQAAKGSKRDGPTLPDGLKALKHPDARVRYKAAETLAQLGTTAKFAVPELRDMLKTDANALVRVKAAEALWKIDPPPASVMLPALLDALKSKDVGVRAAVPPVLALMGTKAKPALPALTEALKDKETEVKLAAIVALGDLGPVARDAAEELMQLAEDKEFFLLEPFVSSALGNLGESVAPTLTKALASRSPERRRIAAYALGTHGPAALPALPELTKALSYNDPGVRTLAARAIGKIGPKAKSALPTLEANLTDKEASVRIAAAYATYAVTGDSKHLGVLVKALSDESVGVRDAACQTLGQMKAGAKDAVAPIMKLLDDKDLRFCAMATLGEIGPAAKKAAPYLQKALSDKDEEVQLRAAYAYWQITGETKAPLKVLEDLLGSEKQDRAAIQLIAAMGPAAKESLETLVIIYRQEEDATFRQLVGIAIKKIDPETGKRLGIR